MKPSILSLGDDHSLESACQAGAYEWFPAIDRVIWSPGLLHLYGLAESPLSPRGFNSFIHPADRGAFETETSSFLQGDVSAFSRTFRINKRDGTTRVVLDRGVVQRIASGTVKVLRGIQTDITEIAQASGTNLNRKAEGRRHSIAHELAELEALYAEAPLGLALLDHELRFVRINAALAEINGYSVDDHIGRTVWELLPDVRESAEPALRQVLEKNEPLRDVVVTGVTPARPGIVREWREHFYPIRDEAGMLGIGIVCEEVTERVAAERALAESEARYRTLVQATSSTTWSCPPNGLQVAPQPEWMAFTGQTAEEMLRDGWTRAVHPDDRAEAAAKWQQAVATGQPLEAEERIRRHDGAWRWMRVLAAPVRDERGDVVSWFGMNFDITERHESEARLRAAHDTFRQLVDGSPFGIYVINADFQLVQVSQGARKVFNNIHPLIGRDFAEVLRSIWHVSFAEEAIARFRHTLATGEPYRAPSTVERRADTAATEAYDWRIERIMLPDGRPGVVCHFYDLSERQRHEEHVQLLLREVNHRSKNMLSLVQSIARQTASTSPIDFLDRFSERMRSLAAAQDLLVRNEWGPVPISDMINGQLAYFADLMGSRISTSGEPLSLTPAATQTLGMAMHELATNAAKYGALSNGSGRVDIEWQIVPGDLPRFVLSWHERGGPEVREPQRRGFGFTVTTRMVEFALSGTVTTEYAPEGLNWRMECDAANVIKGQPVQAHPDLSSEIEPETVRRPKGAGRILVVEDEPLIAAEISSILTDGGFEVLGPASNVTQALALIEQQGCDAAVLDVNLGRETSEPLARLLRRRKTPFVVLSSYGPYQVPAIFRSAPWSGKPVRPAALQAEVARCIAESVGRG